ncbi:MAG: DNA methyltransferase [Metamycoplasmataceae bacterium]
MDCNVLIEKMIQDSFEVDAIITDPPYNISRRNNFKTIGRNGIDFGEWDKNFNQLSWLQNISKIIKNNGTIIIFNDWKNMGDIAKMLEKSGFEVKDLIRWIKPNPMPRNTSRRYVTDYEFAIWATKINAKWTFNKPTEKAYLKPEYSSAPPMGSKRIHPTEKPTKLIEEIIKVHTNKGDVIFDPFSGSGAISFSANKLDRYFIGCEKSKKYYELSQKRIKDSFIKPTFNHLGNKYRMIEELMREFPRKNIDYFVDVFAGSGIVSLNYQTPKKLFLNDNDEWLSKILDYLINNDLEIIINKIEQIIKKYKLPNDNLGVDYKKQYNSLKKDFNTSKSIDKLLVLIFYGFNQQIRFNSKDEFNVPVGKFSWNSYQRNKLINYCNSAKEKKISIRNLDFQEFVEKVILEVDLQKTIFYFDPPYFISNATYNKDWNEKEEEKLINLLTKLNAMGAKWFLSNVIESKGSKNTLLTNFIECNKNIEVIYLNDIQYSNSNYQRKSKERDIEILIKGNINA